MAVNFNNNIIVNITGTAPPVTAAGFGVPLLVASPGSLEVGFTERVRTYEDPDSVANDPDLSASIKAEVAAAYGQNPRVNKIMIGRMDALVAQLSTITLSGAVVLGEVFSVFIDGIQASYTAVNLDTETEVAAGLLAAADIALAALPYSNSSALGVLSIQHDVGTVPFQVDVETDSAACTIVAAVATPATLPRTEMQEILNSSGEWYVLCTQEHGTGFVLDVAAWMQANDRLYIQVVTDPLCVVDSDKSVQAVLKSFNYTRTATIYRVAYTLNIGFSLAVMTLQANPDVGTTTWSYKVLAGFAADNLNSAGQKGFVVANNGNLYIPFYGKAAANPGKLANGEWVDVQLSKDWAKARIEEGLATLLLDYAARNTKIPYTNPGFHTVAAVPEAVLNLGIAAGHFKPGSLKMSIPLAEDATLTDKSNRHFNLGFVIELAGAIYSTTVNGSIIL